MVELKNVVKRNGDTVPFDEKKIESAIARAFTATAEIAESDIPTMPGHHPYRGNGAP